MASVVRRAAPAIAVAGAAVAVVALFDPALGGGAGSSAMPLAASGSAKAPGAGSGTARSGSSGSTDPGTASSATCDTAQEVAGPTVTTRWGPVQVAATVADGQLCGVRAIAWPDGDNRSWQISNYVVPILDARASKQGVEFQGISGATYTSEGYRQSLQGLLDSLG